MAQKNKYENESFFKSPIVKFIGFFATIAGLVALFITYRIVFFVSIIIAVAIVAVWFFRDKILVIPKLIV